MSIVWDVEVGVCLRDKTWYTTSVQVTAEADWIAEGKAIASVKDEINKSGVSVSHLFVAHISESDEEEDVDMVVCTLCKKSAPVKTAHIHQGEWIGDECCWDEKLRSSE